ncbi:MAG: Mut7-C RNAse domain-containing protein [Desulfobacteraceae bacterium]
MGTVSLVFDKEFDFFLPLPQPERMVCCPFRQGASIKDIIESLGVPHTEAGKILVQNREVDFSFVPRPGNLVRVVSLPRPFDVTEKSILRPEPFDAVSFLVDVNAGKLAKILLKLGFDAKYSNAFTDRQIADLAAAERRIVLTRDTALLKRKKILFAKRVRASNPWLQAREVVTCFGLDSSHFNFLSRCSLCNQPLEAVAKESILHRLEPKTRKYYHEFKICPLCRQIFWKGSHCSDMEQKLQKLGMPAR